MANDIRHRSQAPARRATRLAGEDRTVRTYQRHTSRSIHRVGPRHIRYAGFITNNPKITDKGMQTVKGCERLRALYLASTALTDKGLAELKVLDGLRTLNVVNTRVTADAAEKFVDEMPNLRGIRR